MIDLRKFATVSETLSAPFGINREAAASALRDIADKVESGHLIAQGVNLWCEAQIDDFQFETLVIQFAPRREGWQPPKPKPAYDIVSLYNSEGQFAIEVARREAS